MRGELVLINEKAGGDFGSGWRLPGLSEDEGSGNSHNLPRFARAITLYPQQRSTFDQKKIILALL